MISKTIRDLVRRLFNSGDSYRSIAKTAGISPNTARNIVLERGRKNKNKRGPKNKLSRTDLTSMKRSVSSLLDEGRQVTAREVMNDAQIDHVSRWTVRRGLSRLGFNFGKADKSIQLTKNHKEVRLNLARKWLDTMLPWKKVIFTDEKRLNLDGPDSWCSWMREGQKVRRDKRQQGGATLQIWGMLLPNGKLVITELHQWSKSEDYIAMLRNFAIPIMELEYGCDFILQQDNAPIHASKQTTDWIRQYEIALLEWPSRSPDLNPIENVWSLLSQRVYRSRQFKNIAELREEVKNSVDYLNRCEMHKMKHIRDSIQATGCPKKNSHELFRQYLCNHCEYFDVLNIKIFLDKFSRDDVNFNLRRFLENSLHRLKVVEFLNWFNRFNFHILTNIIASSMIVRLDVLAFEFNDCMKSRFKSVDDILQGFLADCTNFLLYGCFQVVQTLRICAIDFIFEVPPKEEVARVEIRAV